MRESLAVTLTVATAAQMRALGAAVARALPVRLAQPMFIALYGDLGAGKTTLVGGALAALGLATHARSPTYTLVEPYEDGDLRVYHLDLYRLTEGSELEMLGVRDLLNSQSVLFIEWPERGAEFLPMPSLEIHLSYGDEGGRQVELRSRDLQGETLRDAVISQINALSS
jgi:tRNA threonylcarbamoyladenosine biosynthesis protein TsaE